MDLKFRNAVDTDVVVGRRFYLRGDDGIYAGKIKEILCPSDRFKAFCAEDGCRYGLDEMFIAVENDPEIQDAYNRGKANERARISQILKL